MSAKIYIGPNCPDFLAQALRSAIGEGMSPVPEKVYCENPPSPEPEIPYFGGCPTCRKSDGFLNYERKHYFICREHKVYWFVGWNLFSSWKGETKADWSRTAALLDTYEEVEPIRDPAWNASPLMNAEPLAGPGSDLRHEEQPIVDALRACATGDITNWTLEQHKSLRVWIEKYPRALGAAAATFISAHIPRSIADRLEREDVAIPRPLPRPFPPDVYFDDDIPL